MIGTRGAVRGILRTWAFKFHIFAITLYKTMALIIPLLNYKKIKILYQISVSSNPANSLFEWDGMWLIIGMAF